MRLVSAALCGLVAAGFLAACSGATSPLPGANGAGLNQTLSLPCHCSHPKDNLGKKLHKHI
jgi:hypothetical protein